MTYLSATDLTLGGVVLLETQSHSDDRGNFCETFNVKSFQQKARSSLPFVQDNVSFSCYANTLRGLHLQRSRPQGKLIRVIRGSIFDVVVDVRSFSKICGTWLGVTLIAGDHKQLWIPPGFAHGFLTLENDTEVLYKTTDYYVPDDEVTIAWDDPQLDIRWPLVSGLSPHLSKKDQAGISFSDFKKGSIK